MKHRVKVTVLDTLLYEDLQREYCQNPCSGKCPVYNKGDVFVFYCEDGKDSFWQCGLNTLVSTNGNPAEVAGGSAKPFCSEAWDAISRYIYTGLQGGSIMKGWMKEENTMIACCSDGTRPVIFKIERIDVSE
ncbi:TIGR04076 family protein [Parasutterella excrementihominis]|uniref:TIGR04076 family protein n=1 Tax=Parasutterella excrementihominis TaxID=487175 RepID=UPI00242DF162|nr:TIGR04076 family protein [Parasutterella excrementihominis]